VAQTDRGETPAGRNLIILCDGTGNELGRNLSNVLKLFRIAEKGKRQLVYYSPGVGTVGRINPWRRLRQKLVEIVGLATGYGLDDNMLGAYRFLVENWREEDRIYLFGFSRGAWTVRVLAGFVHLIGLLRPEQLNMCDSALGTYKRAAAEDDLPLAWHFARVIGARRVSIHFLGLWDTVASVLVPRPDRGWLPSLETLPYTRTNPSVAIVRHAMALDERRRMFRVAPWNAPQDYNANPFDDDAKVAQDIEQRWFPGVHSDIGGGYREEESAVSKLALIWMVDEAARAGLRINKPMFRHLAWGEARPGSKHVYEPPNAAGPIHNSLGWGWWPLELLPKLSRFKEWKRRPSLFGCYWPLGEPRIVRPGEHIDPSIATRSAAVPSYQPVNVP
jgi:uncharacterized protein (DUF2235 family)